jgi:hypothetical protein
MWLSVLPWYHHTFTHLYVPVRACTQLHVGADYVAVSIAVPTASNAVMSQIFLFSVVQLGCWLCFLSGLFSLSWCLCTHFQRKIEQHMACGSLHNVCLKMAAGASVGPSYLGWVSVTCVGSKGSLWRKRCNQLFANTSVHCISRCMVVADLPKEVGMSRNDHQAGGGLLGGTAAHPCPAERCWTASRSDRMHMLHS